MSFVNPFPQTTNKQTSTQSVGNTKSGFVNPFTTPQPTRATEVQTQKKLLASPFDNLNATLNKANAPKPIQTPAGGFNIGDNISKAVSSIVKEAETKVTQLSNGLKLALTPPKITSPIPQKDVVKQQPQKQEIPMVTNFTPGQKQLTPIQLQQMQPNSAQMTVTPQSIQQQKQTVKNLQNVGDKIGETFPQTTKAFNDFSIDPLSLKANPTKAFSDAWNSIKPAITDYMKRNTLVGLNTPSISKNVGQELKNISNDAQVVFSPITALFTAANDVPVLGSATKLLTFPFVVAGEGATKISNRLVDQLPISQQAKNQIKPGMGEIFSLAAQLALGHVIAGGKVEELTNKYGAKDAKTIMKQAEVIAKTANGDLIQRVRNGVATPEEMKQYDILSKAGLLGQVARKPAIPLLGTGEKTPQEVIDHVIQNKLEKTPDGKQLLKTAVEAQKTGQNIAVTKVNPVIDTFEKNIQDYRSFGGKTVGTSTENAALRDITTATENPEVQAHTQEQVTKAIENGEVKINDNGTITLYRGGNPSTKNGLTSATYDKEVAQTFANDSGGTLHEFKVKPEDIKAFIGKAEKEVLVKNDVVNAGENLKQLPYDPSRLEKRVMSPNTVGNPRNGWEAQIRYKGFAADKKLFKTEQEAKDFLKTYEFKGLSNSVSEDYLGSSFDPFKRERGITTQPNAAEAGLYDTGITAYHGSPIDNLKEIGFGEGPRSNPFMGVTKKVKSNAIFFTEDPKVAETFANNRVEYLKDLGEKSGKATVYKRILNIKKPADFSTLKKADEVFEKSGISAEREIIGIEPNYGTGEAFSDLVAGGQAELGDIYRLFDDPKIVEQLKKAGYDGAILAEKGFKAKSYAVFDPKQAREAMSRVAQPTTQGAGLYDTAKSQQLLKKQGVAYTPEQASYVARDGTMIAQSSPGQHAKIVKDIGFKGKEPEALYMKQTGDMRIKVTPTEVNVSFHQKPTPEQLAVIEKASQGKTIIFDDYTGSKVISGEGLPLSRVAQPTIGDVKTEGKRVINTKEVNAVRTSIVEGLQKVRESGNTAEKLQEGYTNLYNDIVKRSNNDKVVLSALRTEMSKEMFGLAGAGGNYKEAYAQLQTMIKEDKELGPVLSKMEDFIAELDKKLTTAQEPARVTPITPQKVKVVERDVPLKPIGTGETTTSTLAGKVEQNAIEKNLIETYGNLPEYQKVNLKEQAKLAYDLLKQDLHQAVQIALGKERGDANILPEMVFSAVEQYAIENSDIALIKQLAEESSLTTQATAMGQRIRALAERNPESPIAIFKDILDNRRAVIEKRMGGKTKEQITKEYVKKVKAETNAPKLTDWASIIKEVRC